MLNKGKEYVVRSKFYFVLGNQCDNVAHKIMQAGGKGYYVSNTPNLSFQGVANDWNLNINNMR